MYESTNSPSSEMKISGNNSSSLNLNRPGSVADTLNLLRGTVGKKVKPFKFQKKMPRIAMKSVWSGVKRRHQADSLLSIMEEEKAREESQKEQIIRVMRLIELTGDSQALATRIKRMELSQLYPSLGPDFLEEVFMDAGYSIEETVRVLEAAYNISPAPMSKERQDEILEQMKERNQQYYYPQYVSERDAYDHYDYLDDVPWSYEDLRNDANVYHNLAKECKDQANRYTADGMPSAALFYRQKAKDYKEREYATNHKAAEILFDKGRERLAKENTLDLHFYHLDEALIAVNRAVSLKEEEYRLRKDKKNTYVNIVTGRGRNSKDGVPILKPAVINHLRDRCFRFEEKSPGMLKVYIGQRI
uniref:Smr domain-containing protein n=1 Tax=Biomphalaria glabrata TaxID=6526 RepID=A0A2C9LV03_BIOGL